MPTFTKGDVIADITLTNLIANSDPVSQYYSANIYFDLTCTLAGQAYPTTEEFLEDWTAGVTSGSDGFDLTTAVELIANQAEPDWSDIADQLWDDADELDGDIRTWLIEVADISIGMQRQVSKQVVESANRGDYDTHMEVKA